MKSNKLNHTCRPSESDIRGFVRCLECSKILKKEPFKLRKSKRGKLIS